MLASWDFTFAEDIERAAPSARIIWCAGLDPGVLPVVALPSMRSDDDAFDLRRFSALATVARNSGAREFASISNGCCRIRIDVIGGTLCEGPVILKHCLEGISMLDPKVLTLRRLIILQRTGRFAASLFPTDLRRPRYVSVLRVFDGLCAGASHREIAEVLFGRERVAEEWSGASDSLKSQVRRLAALARKYSGGGWVELLA